MVLRRSAKHEIDMINGPLMKPFIGYAVPLMLSSILQLMFNAADVAVVGRFAGDNALAAVGSTGSLTTLFVNLFIGLSVGVNVAAAKARGAGDEDRLNRVVHAAMLMSVICGALVTVVGFILAPTMLAWMDTPPEVIDQASLYMRLCFLGKIPMLVYNFGAALLRSVGDTRRPLTFLTIAGVINVVMNLIFVIGFNMDVAGVALATVISQCVSAVLVVISLMRSEGALRFEMSKVRFEGRIVGEIVKVGLPAGIQSTIFSISNVMIQSSINAFGAITVAGNSAGANLGGFVGAVFSSFYQAAVSFTGQNCGAKRYDRLWRILGVAAFCNATIGLALSAGVWFFGDTLLRIYTDSDAVVKAGMVRLAYVCLPHVIGGMMDSVVGILRGMGRSTTPMLVSIVGVCGFRLIWIGAVCSLPQFKDSIDMIYASYPISWTLTLMMHLVCLIFEMRRIRKRNAEVQAA